MRVYNCEMVQALTFSVGDMKAYTVCILHVSMYSCETSCGCQEINIISYVVYCNMVKCVGIIGELVDSLCRDETDAPMA